MKKIEQCYMFQDVLLWIFDITEKNTEVIYLVDNYYNPKLKVD